MAQLYYIQYTGDVEGDCALWWRPNRKGYTTNLDEAGLYMPDEAEWIAKIRGLDRPIREQDALELAKRHVSRDLLTRIV